RDTLLLDRPLVDGAHLAGLIERIEPVRERHRGARLPVAVRLDDGRAAHADVEEPPEGGSSRSPATDASARLAARPARVLAALVSVLAALVSVLLHASVLPGLALLALGALLLLARLRLAVRLAGTGLRRARRRGATRLPGARARV